MSFFRSDARGFIFLRFLRYGIVVALVPFIFGTAHADQRVIVYPKPESTQDQRTNYPVALLRLALGKSGKSYQLQAGTRVVQQARALKALEEKQGIDVVWSMTSIQREEKLLAVEIPIYKGLIGWRLLLIHSSMLDFFMDVSKLEQLFPLVAGQGHDWPDTTILQANGLNVYGASSYEGLFKMLAVGRIDYFPRSVIEIWDEFQAHKEEGLVICPGIVLQYPTAFYYFVNQDDRELAADIERGLENALADGSFDALFFERYELFLQKTKLLERNVFRLNNPAISPKTPLDRSDLRYHGLPAR